VADADEVTICQFLQKVAEDLFRVGSELDKYSRADLRKDSRPC
jgi:hypothetical protein